LTTDLLLVPRLRTSGVILPFYAFTAWIGINLSSLYALLIGIAEGRNHLGTKNILLNSFFQ